MERGRGFRILFEAYYIFSERSAQFLKKKHRRLAHRATVYLLIAFSLAPYGLVPCCCLSFFVSRPGILGFIIGEMVSVTLAVNIYWIVFVFKPWCPWRMPWSG